MIFSSIANGARATGENPAFRLRHAKPAPVAAIAALPSMINSAVMRRCPSPPPTTPKISIQPVIQAGPSAKASAATSVRDCHCSRPSSAKAQGNPSPSDIHSAGNRPGSEASSQPSDAISSLPGVAPQPTRRCRQRM